jgi:hypothetical protein
MGIDRPEPALNSEGNAGHIDIDAGSRYSTLALQIGRLDPIQDRIFRLKVTSGSMSPVLKPGDFVKMEFVPPERLQRGDIVVFQRDGDLVTHRLVSTNAHSYLTKGDALLFFDPLYDRTQLLGRVFAVERNGKLALMRGMRWRMYNRTAGLLYFWEGRIFRLAEWLFRHKRGAQLPAAASLLARLASGILRLPVKILLRLLAP